MRENLGIKLFALLLAVFIWGQSQLVGEHRTVVKLPVSLRSVPKNLTLDRLPQSIPFRVRGKGLEIIKLKLSKVKVVIDASKIKPGTDMISLSDYTIDLPDNINLTLIGPVEQQEITIHADEFHQKRVPVKLAFSDRLTQQRFNALNYQIIPDKIIVFGPKSRVSPISAVYTEAVTKDMSSEREFIAKLSTSQEDVSLSEPQVRVRISSSYQTTKVYDAIMVVSENRKSYFPPSVAVKLSGDSALLNSLKPSQIKAEVNDKPEADGLHIIKVVVPEGIEVVAITPDRVRPK